VFTKNTADCISVKINRETNTMRFFIRIVNATLNSSQRRQQITYAFMQVSDLYLKETERNCRVGLRGVEAHNRNKDGAEKHMVRN
jgi:hypothetical protein